MMPTLSPSPSSTPPPPPPPPPPLNTWGPYSNSGDFRSNAIIILSAFFCAVVLLLALNSIIRFLFCTYSDGGGPVLAQKPNPSDDGSAEAEKATSALVFSKEMAGLAECAICLSEFAEGEGIRVLDVCKHGFHVQCVERWLKVRSSCPTCRTIICSSSSSNNGGLIDEV